MSSFNSSRQRYRSRLAQVAQSTGDSSEAEESQHTATQHVDIRHHGSFRSRAEPSPARTSFSSSSNQVNPARSYFQRTYYGSPASASAPHNSSDGVREDTAELASLALTEVTSIRTRTPPPRNGLEAINTPQPNLDFFLDDSPDPSLFADRSDRYPGVIEEVSEPVSPDSRPASQKSPSILRPAGMQKSSPAVEEGHGFNKKRRQSFTTAVQDADVRRAELSHLNERTALLESHKHQSYTSLSDVESLQKVRPGLFSRICRKFERYKDYSSSPIGAVVEPTVWTRRKVWHSTVVKPIGYVPAIILGLLLNVLDALSYGLILFPLGVPLFSSLGPDGISIFYVSCIVSQLVYSLGGSVFKGGVGSEMIEVVPFFHKMAFTILAQVGEENANSVLATTILSYSLSSILTGVIFYLMGRCKLGSLIGFFPRHILIGCIGGVGWFLVATGLEVSARLDGNLEYSLQTVQKLLQLDTVFLWTTPLVLAITLLITKRWVKHPLTDATYFLSIIIIFYFFVAAIPDLDLGDLRTKGWVFEAPEAGVPFYHFYNLYDFGAVDWKALGSTVPAMFALTFFGVLHVPINIPALGVTTGEDNLDLDRELRAHGWSNALSGFCGSIQNYLVYTNTVLFMRSGGDSRIAGILLAFATFGVLVTGPVLVGFIPIMVVGALIFFLGFNLMQEALYDTWGRVHRLEYFTVLIIVVVMGTYDFVVGILAGIILACVAFVVQSSQISAIRRTLDGTIASSIVRRHAVQHRFLQDVGQQIHVMKLAGYLFFGTIVGVENRIRALLHEDTISIQAIRFLILDLSKVDGVDFSAAEAFARINRILGVRNVQMLMSGVSMSSEIGQSLYNVGLLDEEDGIEVFEDLNSALESCENALLKALYHRGESANTRELSSKVLGMDGAACCEMKSAYDWIDIPSPPKLQFPLETIFSSPRQDQLRRGATKALQEQNDAMPHKNLEQYQQPMQLLLLAFSGISSKNETFWSDAVPFFQRQDYAKGATLYSRGESANSFYILESGLLRAEYVLDQGTFSELIVSGTTCGELPFFSGTTRTSSTTADTDCVTWELNVNKWEEMQQQEPALAREMLTISLKLTSERMDAITKYMLTTG
ncbi:hypothetical protein MMC13_004259 [Lambiella insularis]|nr:hypothetical protein [Lambiella insularis]